MMARKPNTDMDALMGVSKEEAAQAVPFEKQEEEADLLVLGNPKSLTIKLEGPLYAELRDYSNRQERRTGKRHTHQAIMVQALEELLARHKGR